MVQLHEKRVVVVVEHLIGRLRPQPQRDADGVDRVEVVEDDLRVAVRLLAQLPLVVAEEEGPIGGDRAAEGPAELVLVQGVLAGPVENRSRRQRIVHPEVVERPAAAVRARLGHDVHEPAEGAAVLGEIRGVEHAEFLGRLLRRRGARQPREGLDVVGAVHLNQRVQLGLSAKRQPRRGGGADADVRLLEGAAADVLASEGHAARELHEVHEVAAADRQLLDLLRRDDAAELRLAELDQRRGRHDRDLLGDLPDRHGDVRLGRAADGDHHTSIDGRPETGELGPDLVLPGIDVRDAIASFRIGRRVARHAGGDVPDSERHPGQHAAAAVAGNAGERPGGGLCRADTSGREDNAQGEQGGASHGRAPSKERAGRRAVTVRAAGRVRRPGQYVAGSRLSSDYRVRCAVIARTPRRPNVPAEAGSPPSRRKSRERFGAAGQPDYSLRSTCIGSIRAARRPGR